MRAPHWTRNCFIGRWFDKFGQGHQAGQLLPSWAVQFHSAQVAGILRWTVPTA